MENIPHSALELYNFFTGQGISHNTLIFLISMLPIAELRGAIPVGLLVCKQSVAITYLIAVLGNLVPVPFLLILLEPISNKVRHIKLCERFFDWLYHRTTKRAHLVEKYGAIGLILFVAVPLPVTGAWTGSFAASIFRIRFRYAFAAIAAGVLIAGIIVTLVTLTGHWGYSALSN